MDIVLARASETLYYNFPPLKEKMTTIRWSSRNRALVISGLALYLALGGLAYPEQAPPPAEASSPASLLLRAFSQCLQTDGCQVTTVNSFEDLLDLELSHDQQFVLPESSLHSASEQGEKVQDEEPASSSAHGQKLKELEPFQFGYGNKRRSSRNGFYMT